MTQSYTASATSILLAAMIMAATWLPTLATPSAETTRTASAPTHVILA